MGKTWEGRNHRIMEIKKNPNATKNVLFMAGIHSREWISPASTLKFINDLLSDSTYEKYLNEINWYYIPVMNVDGYAYTWSNNRLWRKTRQVYENENCVGADPNRNYPTNAYYLNPEDWYNANGADNDPCSNTYRGQKPFGEKISENLDNFLGKLKHEGVIIDAFMDIHSYSELMMYPYGYKSAEAESNTENLREIAKKMVDDIQNSDTSIPGGKWEWGSVSETIYPAAGITVDYLYEQFGVQCSFTPELRPNADDPDGYGFLLPERYIEPVSIEMTAAYIDLADAVIDGKCRV